jgi:ankyrin repeat protein
MGQTLTSPTSTHDRQALRAAKRGEVDMLLAVLYESPLAASFMDSNGYTPVHHAARQGHVKALQSVVCVIKHEAERLLERESTQTGSLGAGPDGGSSLAACPPEILLQQLVNRKTSKGLTPLMLACKEGHAEVVALLLSLGANPLLVERQRQRSCLHFAASKGV